MTVDVLLIGTGSLAKAFCYAMAKANNLAQIISSNTWQVYRKSF